MAKDIEDLEKELEDAGASGTAAGEDYSPEESEYAPDTGKRLSPREWQEIQTLWEYGTATLGQLAEKYNVRKDTIHKKLKNMGVERGSRAHEVGEVVKEEVEGQVAANARRIHETKENHYRYNDALAKMVMQEIINARQQSRAFATVDANIGALQKAAKSLEIIRKERYTLLGLDQDLGDPDEIPELLISEITPEQVERMQTLMRNAEVIDIKNFDEMEDGDFDDDFVEEN